MSVADWSFDAIRLVDSSLDELTVPLPKEAESQ